MHASISWDHAFAIPSVETCTKKHCLMHTMCTGGAHVMQHVVRNAGIRNPKQVHGNICASRSWNKAMLQLEATDISSVSTSNACRDRFYIRIGLHLVSLDKSCICFSYHGCLGCNCSPDATSDIVYFLFTTSTLQHRAQVASILPNAIEVAIDPCIFTCPPVMLWCHCPKAINLTISKNMICYCSIVNHTLVSMMHLS